MGAVAMRASLEVTTHPRVVEISGHLLPWLSSLGIMRELDPIESELLATAYGQLEPEQRTDANWAGEGAAICCWALGIADRPPLCEPADHNDIVERLKVLHPEAKLILEMESLRPISELQTYVVEVVLIRSQLQQLRDEGIGRSVLEKIARAKLVELGLGSLGAKMGRVAQIVAGMSSEERKRSAGLYFVRELAATWIFDSRERYFAC